MKERDIKIAELICEIETLEEKENTLKAENKRLREAIEDEPEVPGHMQDEMWEAIKGDRDSIEEAMRIVVRQTKEGIIKRALEGE